MFKLIGGTSAVQFTNYLNRKAVLERNSGIFCMVTKVLCDPDMQDMA